MLEFLKLPRVPEPQEMDSAEEVESYNSAAASAHLDAIDDTFVEHLLRLLPRRAAPSGPAPLGLDVGCGPAQIPIKVLARLPALRIIALDGAPNMLRCARVNAQRAGVAGRLRLAQGDGKRLPFADGSFSLVICNSVLHHALDPAGLLRELGRVAARDAAILLRDLRRPPRPLLPWHLWRHGRNYAGTMRKLFDASVQAAYTPAELEELLRAAQIPGARIFRFRDAHIGIEREGLATEAQRHREI